MWFPENILSTFTGALFPKWGQVQCGVYFSRREFSVKGRGKFSQNHNKFYIVWSDKSCVPGILYYIILKKQNLCSSEARKLGFCGPMIACYHLCLKLNRLCSPILYKIMCIAFYTIQTNSQAVICTILEFQANFGHLGDIYDHMITLYQPLCLKINWPCF